MNHRHLPNVPGIYIIACCKSGKAYIGQSITVRRRVGDHRASLRAGRHSNRWLQADWNLYGEAAFKAELIATCSEVAVLNCAEGPFLSGDARYENYSRLYNIAVVPGPPMVGRKHSEATKFAYRQARRGKRNHITNQYRESLRSGQIARNLANPAYRSKLSQFFAELERGTPKTRAAIIAGLCPKRANFFIQHYKGALRWQLPTTTAS